MDTTSVKTFDEICDMISFARQCMSQDLNIKEYTIYENIRKVLKYINIEALILTRQNMLIKNIEKVSNVIFCVDDIDCIYINNKYNYVIYYSPSNKTPSLLIKRFLCIHYPKTELIVLTCGDNNNHNYNTINWVSVLMFVSTTSIHNECNSIELIDILSKQFNNNEFRRMFDEVCNVVVSNQSNITRMDMTRPRNVNNLTNKVSQNLNKILEIIYDIIHWSCRIINEDENVRKAQLYCIWTNSSTFDKVKKDIKISKGMVYETVIKLWNRLNYELTLNVDNVQLIKNTFQNIIYYINIHYKYLVYVFVNLLQPNNEGDIINQHSFIIMKLTEEYDEKVRNLTTIADDMNSLICNVIAHCSK